MGRSSNSQVIGFRYLIGMHMGISRGPVDELLEIKAGDRYIWRGSVTDNTSFQIDAANVFGGEDAEGGIQGTLTTMFGGPTQVAPAELSTIQSGLLPGFRRKMTVFFDGIVSMINPYPKPWKFRVRRTNEGWDGDCWYPERARITLVREVTAAEQQEAASGTATPRTETVFLTQTFDITSQLEFVQFGGENDIQYWRQVGPVQLTLTPPANATVTAVNYVQADNGMAGENAASNAISSSYWSVAGNTLTLQPQPADVDSPATDRPWSRIITIGYTATVVTYPPGTPGTPGGGPAGGGVATIGAMNPIHILYEVYTNREWGRGLPRDALDDANWRQAADILFNERFGMCIRWTRTDSIKSFVRLVLDHINAAIYEDRTTGKFRITLIRGGYDRQQVPLYTFDTGLLEITDAPVLSQGPMLNEIKVAYRDPVTDNERVVRASNLANLQASGGQVNSTTLDMKGIPTAELAAVVAKREMRARTTKVRTFALTLDRRGSGVVPGSVIRIADPIRSIPDTVLRVGSVDYGSLANGRVSIKAVQDVFATPLRGAGTMPPPSWVPPTQKPCVGPAEVFEMPYWALAKTLTSDDFARMDGTDARIGVLVGEGQALNLSYSIASKIGSPSVDEEPTDESYYCGYEP